jgi:hypothetical protein
MTRYMARAREVLAAQIVRVEPLMGRNTTLMAPDSGLILVLDDGTKSKWLAEDGSFPAPDDYVVHDGLLHHDFIVSAAKFRELFTEKE